MRMVVVMVRQTIWKMQVHWLEPCFCGRCKRRIGFVSLQQQAAIRLIIFNYFLHLLLRQATQMLQSLNAHRSVTPNSAIKKQNKLLCVIFNPGKLLQNWWLYKCCVSLKANTRFNVDTLNPMQSPKCDLKSMVLSTLY